MSAAPLVSVRGLQKHFGGIQALKGVDLDIFAGEVHGLVGANGAGKSTLIKVIAGVEKPNAGSLLVDNIEVHLSGSQQAANLGLSFIHQELNLVPCWNALENITLGAPKPTHLGMVDWQAIRAQVQPVADKVGIHFPLTAPMARLSPAEKWLVSICRALVRKARFISMDEPTASLSIRESQNLFQIVRALAAEGVAVLYVSHRLDEIMDLCHRVTAFRDGRSVMSSERLALTRKQLLEAIVGNEVPTSANDPVPHADSRPPSLLRVSQLVRGNFVRKVSFDLQKGEILGLAGLVGSGRTELVRLIFGAEQPESGTMMFEDRDYSPRSPADAVHCGVGFVPEERKAEGLFPAKNIAFNLASTTFGILKIKPWLPLLDLRRRLEAAKEIGSRLRVNASIETMVNRLSGGNQQKIVIGKWLIRIPKLLILDEPSRGVDVGARGEIHRIIRELALQGMSVIVISSDAEELPALCDRVLVIAEGQIVQELRGNTITRDALVRASYHRNSSAA